jgi:hypothetical protein
MWLITSLSAMILGVISLIRIGLSAGRLVATGFGVIGAALPFAVFQLMMLVAILNLPRSTAFRMVCGTNLSGLGKAVLIYSNDHDDRLPRAGGPKSRWTGRIPNWAADNRSDAYGLNSGDGEVSITSSFYLLVKSGHAKPKSFLCNRERKTKEFKTDRYGAAGRELADLWDFGPEPAKHCSFSYHNPYGSYALSISSEPGMAVAADRNPWIASPFAKAKKGFDKFDPDGGREAIKAGNGILHQEDGQNVLFLDSHVGFEKRSFCGINDDNIYTYWDGGDLRRGTPPKLGSQPANRLDSLLVHDPPLTRRK